MNPTVAIIGSHPRTRAAFDFSRDDADVWLFNEAFSHPEQRKWAKRCDAVFQMHVPAIWRNPTNRNDPHHYEWLQTVHDVAVYMQDVYPDVPASRRYPLEDILAMLGGEGAHFLTSSVPQAIALAVYLGYKRIEVYGVAMETNTEYQFQREGVAFWLGFARGRGCEVYFADPTFEAPLYGYEGKVSVEYEEFERRIAELMPSVAPLQAQYAAAKLDAHKAVELLVEDGSKEREQALIACVRRVVEIGAQLSALDGAVQENERYRGKADAMKAAAEGEFVFSRQEFEGGATGHSQRANEANTAYIVYGTQLGNAQRGIMQSARGSKKRAEYGQAFLQVMERYLEASNKAHLHKGAALENQYYMTYLDRYVRAAGGEKSEAVLLESMSNAAP